MLGVPDEGVRGYVIRGGAGCLNSLAELEADGEFAHAVWELFERVDDGGLVFQLLPEFVDDVGMAGLRLLMAKSEA